MPGEKNTHHPHTLNMLCRDSSFSHCSTFSTPTTVLMSMTHQVFRWQWQSWGLLPVLMRKLPPCCETPCSMIHRHQSLPLCQQNYKDDCCLPRNHSPLCYGRTVRFWPHVERVLSTWSKMLNRFHFRRTQWKINLHPWLLSSIYRCTVESILANWSTIWYGHFTKQSVLSQRMPFHSSIAGNVWGKPEIKISLNPWCMVSNPGASISSLYD